MINIKIDNKSLQVEEKTTILDASKEVGVYIPTLCYNEAVSAYGACRLCTVEIEIIKTGRRRMVTACNYPIEEGINVFTNNERVIKARKLLIELLLARCPEVKVLHELAKQYNVSQVRFSKKQENCILCGLCIRVCAERLGIGAIGVIGRGTTRKVGIPFELPESDVCVACGGCTYVCPTGAIQMEANTLARFRRIYGINNRKCRYMLMGVVDNKLCPNNYECYHCEVDQRMEETFGTHPALVVKKAEEYEPIKVDEFFIEPELFYSTSHTWIKPINGKVRIGLDDFARRLISPIDDIKVKNVDNELKKGDIVWQLICGNKYADMHSPIDGRIVEINSDILDNPKIISASPYRIGWIYTIAPYNFEQDKKKLLSKFTAKQHLREHSQRLHQRLSEIGVTITDGGQITPALHQRLTDKAWQELINEFF